MSFSPAACPVCSSIGARALMLDHIEAEHPGPLRSAGVTNEMVERAWAAYYAARDLAQDETDAVMRAALEAALR